MKSIYGIQGGPGSFNDEVALLYLRKKKLKVSIAYLYTTEAVLGALKAGEIKYGQFAIVNSKGGLVEETLSVLGKYPFGVEDDFSMPIRHCLLVRKDAPKRIQTIMGHPQAFKQCERNLDKYYPKQKKISGRGKMIDPSKAAESLAAGRLPSTVAVLGSATLAKIFDLKIFRRDLQDDPRNRTTFLVVRRLDQ
jgi:chorismate mutase/prephenate dehydratase